MWILPKCQQKYRPNIASDPEDICTKALVCGGHRLRVYDLLIVYCLIYAQHIGIYPTVFSRL